MFVQWLSDGQFLRWQTSNCNLHPVMLVVMDKVLNKQTPPRLPTPHLPAEKPEHSGSPMHEQLTSVATAEGRESPAQHAARPHYHHGNHSHRFLHAFPPSSESEAEPSLSASVLPTEDSGTQPSSSRASYRQAESQDGQVQADEEIECPPLTALVAELWDSNAPFNVDNGSVVAAASDLCQDYGQLCSPVCVHQW